MKYSEIIELSDKELAEHLDNEREYLTRLRLNHAISPLDNPHKITATRRNISRLMTEVRRRQSESEKTAE